ncbi:unnamed protein product [Prunus armeniaca]
MRLHFEDSFILFASAVFLSSVTASKDRSDSHLRHKLSKWSSILTLGRADELSFDKIGGEEKLRINPLHGRDLQPHPLDLPDLCLCNARLLQLTCTKRETELTFPKEDTLGVLPNGRMAYRQFETWWECGNGRDVPRATPSHQTKALAVSSMFSRRLARR